MESMLIINWQVLLLILLIALAFRKEGLLISFSDQKGPWQIRIQTSQIFLFPILKKTGFNKGWKSSDKVITSPSGYSEDISPSEYRYEHQCACLHFLIFEFYFIWNFSNDLIKKHFPKGYNYQNDPSWEGKIELYKIDYYQD